MIINIITMWEMLAISTYRQDPNVYCFFFVIAVVAFIKVIFDVTEKRDISKAQFNWNIIKTVFFTWIFISFLFSLTYVNNDKVIGLTKKTYQIEQMQEVNYHRLKSVACNSQPSRIRSYNALMCSFTMWLHHRVVDDTRLTNEIYSLVVSLLKDGRSLPLIYCVPKS